MRQIQKNEMPEDRKKDNDYKEDSFLREKVELEIEKIREVVKAKIEEKARNLDEDLGFITIKNILINRWKEKYFRKIGKSKIEEIKSKKQGKVYTYTEYLKKFNKFKEKKLDREAREVFEEMAPKKYKWYIKNGIYQDPSKDPVIKKSKHLARNDFYDKNKELKKKRYKVGDKERYEKILISEYQYLVRNYPLKAEAYKCKIPELKKAFEIVEQKERLSREREKIKRERNN